MKCKRGYVDDEETGLYYLRSRYYQPRYFRFANADIYLGHNGLLSGNIFAYCKNNAVMYFDPSGHSSEWWFAIRHPIIAIQIGKVIEGKRNKNISTTAVRFAIGLGLSNPKSAQGEGTQVNAMRHAVWTGIISSRYGDDIARDAARSHEDALPLELGDLLVGKSATEISRLTFDKRIAADSICDILNNEIAFSLDLDGMNGKEVCSMLLEVYHSTGLWVITEITDDNGVISDYRITKECLSDSQYKTALELLSGLDEYGFSD